MRPYSSQPPSYVHSLPNNLQPETLFARIPEGTVLWNLYEAKLIKLTEKLVVKTRGDFHRLQDDVVLMEYIYCVGRYSCLRFMDCTDMRRLTSGICSCRISKGARSRRAGRTSETTSGVTSRCNWPLTPHHYAPFPP